MKENIFMAKRLPQYISQTRFTLIKARVKSLLVLFYPFLFSSLLYGTHLVSWPLLDILPRAPLGHHFTTTLATILD